MSADRIPELGRNSEGQQPSILPLTERGSERWSNFIKALPIPLTGQLIGAGVVVAVPLLFLYPHLGINENPTNLMDKLKLLTAVGHILFGTFGGMIAGQEVAYKLSGLAQKLKGS